jgi:hypothetical protein
MTREEAADRIIVLEQQRYVLHDVCSNKQSEGFRRAMREIAAEQFAMWSIVEEADAS